MSVSPVSLGLDLGTSGIKAVLMDEHGVVVASAGAEYVVRTPHPTWAETAPAEWEAAARSVVREVLAAAPGVKVVGIGLDAQMHGLVLVDADGEALRPAMLWPDARATAQVSIWQDSAERGVLANPIVPGMSGPMLRWVKDNEPAVFDRARKAVSPKDWLRNRLVPGVLTDPTDASATLMWDVPANDWAYALMDGMGIDAALLPPLRSADESVGVLSKEVAASWGLPAGIPVSAGCGDVPATIHGLGAGGDQFTIIVGTGGQVIRTGAPAVANSAPTHHTYRAVDGSHFAMSAIQNAGLALRWVAERLDATWDELYAAVPREPHQAGGDLIFLPYLVGERSPVRVSAGTAGWRNLVLGASRRDLLRSAAEGVAFALRFGLEALPAVPDGPIDIVGGGVRSPYFRQLLADVLGQPVRLIAVSNLTAAGAARLGWSVAGRPDVQTAIVKEDPISPSPTADYKRQWKAFVAATRAL